MFIEKGKKQNTKMVLLVTHFLSMVCYPVDDDYYGRKGNKLEYGWCGHNNKEVCQL